MPTAIRRRPRSPGAHPGGAAALRATRRSSACVGERDGARAALGEVLSEPKPGTWFEAAPHAADDAGADVVLDRRSRMLYDERSRLHQRRGVSCRAAAMRNSCGVWPTGAVCRGSSWTSLGAEARALLDQWLASGWLRPESDPPQEGE